MTDTPNEKLQLHLAEQQPARATRLAEKMIETANDALEKAKNKTTSSTGNADGEGANAHRDKRRRCEEGCWNST